MFEDVGVCLVDMCGSNCGVFVGVVSMDYGNCNMDDLNVIDLYLVIGNMLSIVLNCVFYLFDLCGLSMMVDIVCLLLFVVFY